MGPEVFVSKVNTSGVSMERMDSEKWKNYTIQEIKAELRKRNAKLSGRKADLIAR